ncbi:hypothetical protein IH779_00440 [Patescibacteria group bacterium]|nr:hypothetical protein [Patescibacteria group bacterium]
MRKDDKEEPIPIDYFSPETIRQAKARGRFWQCIRRQQNKTKDEVSEATGATRYQVAQFEKGLILLADLPKAFIVHLAGFLGRESALDENIQRFEYEYLFHT